MSHQERDMSKVFVQVSVSLDGYMAPEGMTLEHGHDPTYKNWMARWTALQAWNFPQEYFRKNLKLGDGGETGADNDLLIRTFERTGASVMGKNMFAGGERFWPEEAPFHTPVFVVTHHEREPWPRPGGTTFHFVTDDILMKAGLSPGNLYGYEGEALAWIEYEQDVGTAQIEACDITFFAETRLVPGGPNVPISWWAFAGDPVPAGTKSLTRAFQHELGHCLGLADEYNGSESNLTVMWHTLADATPEAVYQRDIDAMLYYYGD